jgi:lipopolysaccharide/colanic/teichoic acid biosynthesis glycosyltransferase
MSGQNAPAHQIDVRRAFDIIVASVVLIVAAPVMALVAAGIRFSSPGPILFRTTRIGRDRRRLIGQHRDDRPDRRRTAYLGRAFTMYKFRTMHVRADAGPPITSFQDPRVFPFGKFLRRTKLDELPQLFNVLKGEMAIVGPRPEAPEIVRDHYTPEDIETLLVRPGLTSPGSIYYYTVCEATLGADDAVDAYVQRLLPVKLDLDRRYIRNAHVLDDLRLIVLTVLVIARHALAWRSARATPVVSRSLQPERPGDETSACRDLKCGDV